FRRSKRIGTSRRSEPTRSRPRRVSFMTEATTTVSPNRRDQMKSGKILVVDDEPAEREGLARLVGQWGYDVETASSGEEALNLVESQHPAVVVTDLVLPEMDGLTLLQQLKETGRPPLVLLVPGHGTVADGVGALRP